MYFVSLSVILSYQWHVVESCLHGFFAAVRISGKTHK